MIAALIAAAAAVGTPFEQPTREDPLPALSALGPQPGGSTALTLWAGQPYHGLRLDHGLWDALDVGIGLDVWPQGYYRPTVQARVRAFEWKGFQLTFRGTAGRLFAASPTVVETTDGELALQLGFALVPRLSAFGEGSLLGSTDFTREHTAGFTQLQGGLAFAPPGPVSLIASAGVLRGSLGSRTVASGGAAFRF
ncbi:MAG TPA: hypothetical protein VE964_12635 [Myxococcales bacterium]|nr:hypothetical protein [Myxococcales bacterium]